MAQQSKVSSTAQNVPARTTGSSSGQTQASSRSVAAASSQPTAMPSVIINPNGPPAYITWKTPLPNTHYPPLFKIGSSTVTMEWGIDRQALAVPPDNLTVAVISPQKETIVVAELGGAATSATWDLVNISRPLMVGFFTVLVYDQRGPTAIPQAGQLMPDNRLTLGLYSPEAYIERTNSKFCPTCLLQSGTREYYQSYTIIITISLITSFIFTQFFMQLRRPQPANDMSSNCHVEGTLQSAS
ncbi:hypothetical protein NQZ79_g5849 [Umbelopsis isabellina]|nr:hypothetical protein NQZ79_g5849 [Umbelopsis isabellina]